MHQVVLRVIEIFEVVLEYEFCETATMISFETLRS